MNYKHYFRPAGEPYKVPQPQTSSSQAQTEQPVQNKSSDASTIFVKLAQLYTLFEAHGTVLVGDSNDLPTLQFLYDLVGNKFHGNTTARDIVQKIVTPMPDLYKNLVFVNEKVTLHLKSVVASLGPYSSELIKHAIACDLDEDDEVEVMYSKKSSDERHYKVCIRAGSNNPSDPKTVVFHNVELWRLAMAVLIEDGKLTFTGFADRETKEVVKGCDIITQAVKAWPDLFKPKEKTNE